MATTVGSSTTTTSPWSKPGAWALDSEQNESELAANHHSTNTTAAATDFPSLSAAASTKTKKKKPQTLSLQQFTTHGSSNRPESKGLTPEDLMNLPTGPRQRTAEELDRSKLGGGFKSYGSDRYGSGSDEKRNGGFSRDSSRESLHSRADVADDWGKSKTGTMFGNGFDRRERGERNGFFSDSQSRADESENWGSNKISGTAEGRRFGGTNGGGVNSENWGKNKREEEGRRLGGMSGAFDSLRERRGGVNEAGESENWGRKGEEGGVGRPRLNLQRRTLPVGVEDGVPQNGLKPKVGLSPFGEARPREEVLKEKGKDWKEIDEKLESRKMREVGGVTDEAKRGFGSGNGRLVEDRSERSWRKNDSGDVRSQSAENSENELAEETEDSNPKM